MPLLVLLILAVPVAAAVVVAALGPRNLAAVRWVALAAVLLDLGLTGALVARAAPILAARNATAVFARDDIRTFEPIAVPGEVGRTHRTNWDLFEIPVASPDNTTPAVQFYLGLDGLNIWLVALTSLLMVPSVLVSWNSIKERGN